MTPAHRIASIIRANHSRWKQRLNGNSDPLLKPKGFNLKDRNIQASDKPSVSSQSVARDEEQKVSPIYIVEPLLRSNSWIDATAYNKAYDHFHPLLFIKAERFQGAIVSAGGLKLGFVEMGAEKLSSYCLNRHQALKSVYLYVKEKTLLPKDLKCRRNYDSHQ